MIVMIPGTTQAPKLQARQAQPVEQTQQNQQTGNPRARGSRRALSIAFGPLQWLAQTTDH